MTYLDSFKKQTEIISKFDEGNAYMGWAMSLYLDYPDVEQLISESLTESGGDRKIDFLRIDLDEKRIVIAQGFYTQRDAFYKAKSNKASDLNTAIAWILSGEVNDISNVPNRFDVSLRDLVIDCREAITNGEIDQIDVLYVHNLAESSNVAQELETVASNLRGLLVDKPEITISAKEVGAELLQRLFDLKQASIVVTDKIECPVSIQFEESADNWKAGILSIPGTWLHELYNKFGDSLFSANYRGFLGIKRKRINTNIKQTVERKSENFWVYNNGITILTTKFYPSADKTATIIEGISIINGAQTTGSIGSVSPVDKLKNVKVICRVIQCSDVETKNEIIRFNNTQNDIKTWDSYSNNPEQQRIKQEFAGLGYDYSIKRGFGSTKSGLSIEQVAQPVIALHGNYNEPSKGRNNVFDTKNLYDEAFQGIKSKHILFAYCIVKSIDIRRNELKQKHSENKATQQDIRQLSLLRNLRFKYFLMAVIGNCLEEILDEPVDVRQIAFANKIAGLKYNSIDDLSRITYPIVALVLQYVSVSLKKEFVEIIYDREEFSNIINQVKSNIQNTRLINSQVFETFAEKIEAKG